MRHPIGTEVICVVRGKRCRGVVAGEHYLQRKGKTRALAAHVTGNPHSLDRLLTEVVSMDEVVFYRVEDMEPTGHTVPAREAIARLATVKNEIKGSHVDRECQNYAASREAGLRDIEEGTTIQANFRDSGWTDVTFAGFVKSSGNVRYIHRGRKRTMAPKFFRLKPEE